jgi:hypothetical protein
MTVQERIIRRWWWAAGAYERITGRRPGSRACP